MRPVLTRLRSGARHLAARRVAAAKAVLAILLLGLLAHNGALSPGTLVTGAHPAGSFAVSAGALLVALGVGVQRWRLVMRAFGAQLGYWSTLRIYWVGAFASTLLPGAASGDILRAIWVAREVPEAGGLAALSVIVDRFIGLLGFAVTGLLLLLTRWEIVASAAPLLRILSLLLLVTVTVIALASGIVWLLRVLGHLQFGKPSSLISRVRSRISATLERLRTLKPLVALQIAFSSLLIPLLLTAALLPFLPSGVLNLGSLADIGIASVAAQVANVLPLTPGGIGVGEGTFGYVLGLLSHSDPTIAFATAFLGLRLVSVGVNGAGALFLLVPGNSFSRTLKSPSREATAHD